jgi:rhomboid protease GluP
MVDGLLFTSQRCGQCAIRFYGGWPLSIFSASHQSTATAGARVHAGRARTQLRNGLILILLGLLGLIPLKAMSAWYHGGPMPEPRAFIAVACLFFLPLGALTILNAIRGLPRLTIRPDGVTLQLALTTRWANWDSLDPFVVKITQAGRSGRKVKTASAKITGANAGKGRSINIPNHFDSPIEEIAADLNATRASSLGISETFASVTTHEPAAVGLPGFGLPWVTFALLGVLIGIFILENKFPVSPSGKSLSPTLQTLIAMGALSHTAIIDGGEWYRLFTAPLLHANFAHLLGNGVALLLGGWLLERLVGRLWFFVLFAIGALGGSLLSLAIGPATSVGASGALMGLFAGLFVSSFRLASGTVARTRLQVNSLRILIPALLPSISTSTGPHIDYSAHFGGALAGAALAFALLKSWPETALIPQQRRAAAFIAAIGLLLFVGSVGMAVANYPKYDIAIIPPNELPRTQAEYRERAAALVARYPNDPRSHIYLGETLAEANDNAGAERELRLALTISETQSALLGPQVALMSRGTLAIFLTQQGRQDEAKAIARPACLATGDTLMKNFAQMLTAQHLCD